MIKTILINIDLVFTIAFMACEEQNLNNDEPSSDKRKINVE